MFAGQQMEHRLLSLSTRPVFGPQRGFHSTPASMGSVELRQSEKALTKASGGESFVIDWKHIRSTSQKVRGDSGSGRLSVPQSGLSRRPRGSSRLRLSVDTGRPRAYRFRGAAAGLAFAAALAVLPVSEVSQPSYDGIRPFAHIDGAALDVTSKEATAQAVTTADASGYGERNRTHSGWNWPDWLKPGLLARRGAAQPEDTRVADALNYYGIAAGWQGAAPDFSDKRAPLDDLILEGPVKEARLAHGEQLPDDLHCLAQNIYFEARSEPKAGKLAVAHVVLNRVDSGRFPSSVCNVVRQGGEMVRHRCQFSWWCDGKSDQPRDRRAWRESVGLAKLVLGGRTDDPTAGALWYHADYVSPNWRHTFLQGPTIGRHIFYSVKPTSKVASRNGGQNHTQLASRMSGSTTID